MSAPVIDTASAVSNRFNPGTTTFNLTLPAGIPAGAVIFVEAGRHLDTLGTSDSGWVDRGGANGPSGYGQVRFFTKVAAGGETVLSVTGDGAHNTLDCSYTAFYITGAHASSFWYVDGFAQATSNNPNPGLLSPGVGAADFLWLALFAARGQTNYSTSPTNYVLVKAVNGSGFNTISLAVSQRSLNAASEDPGAFGLSASRENWALTIGIRPAAGAPPAALASTVRL